MCNYMWKKKWFGKNGLNILKKKKWNEKQNYNGWKYTQNISWIIGRNVWCWEKKNYFIENLQNFDTNYLQSKNPFLHIHKFWTWHTAQEVSQLYFKIQFRLKQIDFFLPNTKQKLNYKRTTTQTKSNHKITNIWLLNKSYHWNTNPTNATSQPFPFSKPPHNLPQTS